MNTNSPNGGASGGPSGPSGNARAPPGPRKTSKLCDVRFGEDVLKMFG